ncbi:hypothetical protein FHT97_006234 [Rhizobium sp. BK399]|nr:hypothetical protein [Rhizobium sp. BK399]
MFDLTTNVLVGASQPEQLVMAERLPWQEVPGDISISYRIAVSRKEGDDLAPSLHALQTKPVSGEAYMLFSGCVQWRKLP